jgi:NADH-quinone oxidoreductase subunit L
MEHQALQSAHVFRDLAWLIPLLPFAALVVILFFGKRLPGKGAPVGIAAIAAALVLGAGSFLEAIRAPNEIIERSITWVSFGSTQVQLGMRVDTLASMMFVVVCFVSLMVQIYSLGYMKGEVRYTWYYAALSLFTGSMLLLVIAASTLQLLVGWELVGISSYILIGHWFEEKENSNAANKAFITTRAGDLGFLVGIFVLFIGARTFNIGELQARVAAGEVSSTVVTAGAVLLFMGAMGKSAQFPLHVWLPDAMAGPTPVSALIHAATMVTAGVYMVARIYGVFSSSAAAMREIAIIASITMVMAAAMAVVARDIKRVLAYSTVSQLAYMMAGLAVGGYTAGIFHLWTHAFFKALLFLGAGSVIHAVHSNDMFEMGGLRRFMPITFWTFLIGSAALAGLPPLAGFWSKDEIIASALHSNNRLVLVCALATAFMTAFYMARACTLTFFGRYRRLPVIAGGADEAHEVGLEGEELHVPHGPPHESPPSMRWPLIILAALSCVAGLVGTPLRPMFGEWIHFGEAGEGGFVVWLAAVSVGIALIGILLGWTLYSRAPVGFGVVDPLERALGPVYRAAVKRFWIDDLYMKLIVRPVQYGLSKLVYGTVDQRVIDRVVNAAGVATVLAGRGTRTADERGVDGMVNGLGRITTGIGQGVRRMQTGNVQRYAVGLFLGVAVLAAFFLR